MSVCRSFSLTLFCNMRVRCKSMALASFVLCDAMQRNAAQSRYTYTDIHSERGERRLSFDRAQKQSCRRRGWEDRGAHLQVHNCTACAVQLTLMLHCKKGCYEFETMSKKHFFQSCSLLSFLYSRRVLQVRQQVASFSASKAKENFFASQDFRILPLAVVRVYYGQG